MPSISVASAFEHLDTYRVPRVYAGATIAEMLTAARYERLPLCEIHLAFPAVPVEGIAAHEVNLIEVDSEKSLSLDQFTHGLAECGYRPASIFSALKIFAEMSIYSRRWPSMLCLPQGEYPSVLEFTAFSGALYASALDLRKGISGHYLLLGISI